MNQRRSTPQIFVAAALFGLALGACGSQRGCGSAEPSPRADAMMESGDGATATTASAVTAKTPIIDADAGPDTIVDIGTGWSHTCVRQASGVVACWGTNTSGELGLSEKTRHAQTPTIANTITNAGLVVGGHATCAQTTIDGLQKKTKCWGGIDHLFGNESIKTSSTPIDMKMLSLSSDAPSIVALGWTHGCTVDARGGVVTCSGGPFVYRGFGAEKMPDYFKPIVVTTGFVAKVTALAMGYSHVCALLGNGSVSCFGANDHGQLGANSPPDDNSSDAGVGGVSATPIAGLQDIAAITAGRDHTCALAKNGHVLCWGQDYRGQLGGGEMAKALCHAHLGDSPCSRTPVEVRGVTDAVEIRAGVEHTCARLRSGKIKCWGDDSAAQLGTKDIHDQCPMLGSMPPGEHERLVPCARTPVDVDGIDNAVRLSAGNHFTCAVLRTNELACWGDNSEGALGALSVEECEPPNSVKGPCSPTPVRFSITPTAEQPHPKIKRPAGSYGWDEPIVTLTGKLVHKEVASAQGGSLMTTFLIVDSPITVYDVVDAGLDSTGYGDRGPETELWFVNKKPIPKNAYGHHVTITGELQPMMTGHHHSNVWIAGDITSILDETSK